MLTVEEAVRRLRDDSKVVSDTASVPVKEALGLVWLMILLLVSTCLQRITAQWTDMLFVLMKPWAISSNCQ